ncbi:MAG: DUF6498-containing protein [Gemmatimonadaceae bacterium]|nr:DUF6498-containing protein [Gemmatimonadaceae bacterium]
MAQSIEDTPPDRALWSIVASNVLAAVLAIVLDWDVVELLWPFWIQSVVIGYYARRRMLMLRQFSVEGLSFGDRPATESPEDQRSTANFFAFHYGFFHFGYFLYLMQRSTQQQFDFVDANLLVVVALAFVFAHRQSHREHVAADLAGRPNLGALMFMPYLRVVPMHLVILFGATQGGGAATILLFTVMKTLADIGMHKFEHRKLQGAGAG